MGLFDIFKKKKPVAENKETEEQSKESLDTEQEQKSLDEKTENLDIDTENNVSDESSASKDISTTTMADPQPSSTPKTPAEPQPTSDSAGVSEDDDIEVDDTASASETEPVDEQEEYDAGLQKTRHSFRDKFNAFMANFRSVDEDFFEDLEDLLIQSDVGYEMALKISDSLRTEVKLKNVKSQKEVSHVIVEKMAQLYQEDAADHDFTLNVDSQRPLNIILFVGVNGAGKTTTIGKLAAQFKSQGQKVLLAAGDTFRAGAIEQLQSWGEQVGVTTVASKAGSDPAAVVFEAIQTAKKEQYDILLVDTAGRLQNNTNLMKELEKIKRIITREVPDAPHEVLLVIDATTGQNALSQAKQFEKTTQVTGIVLTKLDGSSQGGIVLAINDELHIPVKLVGLGEKVQDLQIFDPQKFATGLFSNLLTEE